ncbi:helix-turn-helix domain-containing protein [Sphingomonas colocasiae]|uniref:Helix-turn-helix domain-containing protein n=1 Tax=Sphingomonas colocasiae TaxID=1848973 RepID=A0ABS7PQE1_9SPHN|nr:helix-turn-helix domain-containing protein [Sphingomonas colocasiae]MBY8823443.1 helix-turn-helix domain-containing protein [Sphingomonas colocasiae]
MSAGRDLAEALQTRIMRWDVTWGCAGERIGTDRVSVNRPMRGELSRVPLDTLLDLSVAAGLHVELAMAPADDSDRRET